MKRPRTALPKRPRAAFGAVARSRKEAAIQLVRLEFDLSRLEMGLEQAERRAAQARAEAAERQRQRAALLELLTRG